MKFIRLSFDSRTQIKMSNARRKEYAAMERRAARRQHDAPVRWFVQLEKKQGEIPVEFGR